MPSASGAKPAQRSTWYKPASRLFIVELDLTPLSGHFFNQVLGFKLAAEELGLVPCVLLRKDVDASLAEPLAGQRVIEFDSISPEMLEYELDSFAETDRQLQSLWAALERMAISRRDIVMITSGRPLVIYSLGAWLGRLNQKNRPAVFLRFFNHDYLDPNTMEFSEQSWIYRFAASDLSLRLGQEHVFFTVNNDKLLTPLARLCMRRVFHMPLPKYYGEMAGASGANLAAPVIYIHVNARSGVMLEAIQSVIGDVLERHPAARFRLKYVLSALRLGAAVELRRDLIERGVELLPTEQSPSDYLRTIAESDIVVLPYEVTDYAGRASGVFAEGAALGKVMVYPSPSWMDDQVAEGYAVGVGFTVTNQTEVSEAILRALGSWPLLLKEAGERAAAFRQQHSCRRNLELMLDLAAVKHDMRLTYALGSPISFRKGALSRAYMGRGWSYVETEGVWTVGSVAELSFRVEPRPAGCLRAYVCLTPFFADGHSQRIVISVNGVALCDWSFSGRAGRSPIWRVFTIPSPIATSDEVNMVLEVKNPLSPRQAGISSDARPLGVMFHEMLLNHTGPRI
jgi:hypothetical protein